MPHHHRAFRIWRVLLSLAAVVGCEKPGFSAQKPEHPATCNANGKFSVVDSSIRLTKLFAENHDAGLDALYRDGVRTVFRYYDMPVESIACKTLLPFETDAILRSKLRIGVVFQHNSDDPKTFIDAAVNAKAHAGRALELAAANGQPKDSAIYFGVDGAELHLKDAADTYTRRAGRAYSAQEIAAMKNKAPANWYNEFLDYRSTAFKAGEKITEESLYPFLKIYFETIAEVFKEHADSHPNQSYKIGIYCTGEVCQYARENGLASFYWLTAEGSGDSSYSKFIDNNPWHLLQQFKTVCSNWSSPELSKKDTVEIDFDRRSDRDIGDWNTVGERTPIPRPKKCRQD